jgi:hypothetical protein
LKNSEITKKYDPVSNYSDNLVYSIIYISYLKEEVKKYIEGKSSSVSDEDQFLFALASYNMGINKWKVLYKASGNVNSREDFVKYIVKDLMKLEGKGNLEKDPAYNVEYTNYFGKEDYSQNKNIIFEDKGKDISLKMSKANVVVRYVEMYKGLKTHLSQDQKDYDNIKVLDNNLYPSIIDRLHTQEDNKDIKQ